MADGRHRKKTDVLADAYRFEYLAVISQTVVAYKYYSTALSTVTRSPVNSFLTRDVVAVPRTFVVGDVTL